MFSQYSWGQFSIFVLALVVLYYVAVALLYYRDELGGLLTPKAAGTAKTGGAAPTPPALVRTTSAFRPAAPDPAEAAPRPPAPDSTAAAGFELAAEGAAQNLPEAAEIVVGGALPDSSATATGRDDGRASDGPMAAAAAIAASKAAAADETRTEDLDHADERLAALIRKKAHQMPPPEEPTPARPAPVPAAPTPPGLPPQPAPFAADEPAETSFNEPLAPLPSGGQAPAVVSAGVDLPPDELLDSEALLAYLVAMQAGAAAPVPSPLAGTQLAELMEPQSAPPAPGQRIIANTQ